MTNFSDDLLTVCVRCGTRKPSVTPESGVCSSCIREKFEGSAVPSVARMRRPETGKQDTAGFLSQPVIPEANINTITSGLLRSGGRK